MSECNRCGIKNVHIYNAYTGHVFEDTWGHGLETYKIKTSEFNDISEKDVKAFQEGY